MDIVSGDILDDSTTDAETQEVRKNGKTVAVIVDGSPRTGFKTPSRKQELYSETMVEWGWEEYSLPVYIKSHVHPDGIDKSKGEMVLVPTFRLPTLIHSRSGHSKWLTEIANRNPLWLHTPDAPRLALVTGRLVRVSHEIG